MKSLPAIFASVLICIMNIRKGIPDIRIISEHRLRLNMQILHKFQDTWPIAIWTRHLLDGLLKISTEQSFTGDDSRDVSTTDDPCHIRDSHHGVYEGVPDLAGVDGMAIVSPPTSISDGNIFSSDGLNESHLAGFPASFPFQNLFEEVGLNSESIWY